MFENLLDALFGQAVQELLGSGLEQVGEEARRRWGRLILFSISVGITLYILVATLWLWRSPAYPDARGLLQFTSKYGMLWIYAVPALACLTLIILLIPVAGRLSIALISALATCVVGFAGIITLQGSSQGIDDLATTISMLSTLLLVLTTLALAINDHPPLQSSLAHWAFPYWMRLNHLRALLHFATDRHWQVVGPAGADNTLLVYGDFSSNHLAYITSAMRLRLSQSNATDGAILSIAMRSPFDIPGFYCGPSRLDSKARQNLEEIEIPRPNTSPLYFYIQPYAQLPLSGKTREKIIDLMRERQKTLPKDAILQATPLGMRITIRRMYRRLTAKDGQPEKVLYWLDQVITTLEAISPLLSEQEQKRRWEKYKPALYR